MAVPLEMSLANLARQRHTEGGLRADHVLESLSFRTMLDLLPRGDAIAVYPMEGERAPLSHSRLSSFVSSELGLHRFGLGRNDRVAILLPNGPELAVAFVAVLTYCTCAPLNPAATAWEIKAELVSVRAKAILLQAGEDNNALLAVAEELNLTVLLVTPSPTEAGIFSLSDAYGSIDSSRYSEEKDDSSRFEPQQRDDTAMVLHTSGSTGNKKVVPHTLGDLLAGAICIAAACELKPTDICCNQMPLFHIGGIARNVLAPILSGGAVVAMPYFEPNVFWRTVISRSATWYYAGPTMHMLILDAFKAMVEKPKISLRFIANAAGPLLPSVAEDMRDTYSEARGSLCSIMPSYGMTECMPISSPPVGYNLDRPGTSGQIVGPFCQIQDGDGRELPPGPEHVGQIMVKGHPVTHGYERNQEANAENFMNGWFKTGDLGYLDTDGYLYVTGRSKEVINRGGEIISPTEIEEALLSHPAVKNIVAFSAPHDVLQEVVAVCVVTHPGHPRVGVAGLQAHAAESLHPSKWPFLIVYAADIPKTGTGKAMRVRLDKRMGLPCVSDGTPELERLFEADMPPAGAGAQSPIPTTQLLVDLRAVENALTLAGIRQGVDDVHAAICEVDRTQRLVAYVSPATVDVLELQAELVTSQHEYNVPSMIVAVASIPRTAEGSVDEAALPTPSMRKAYSPPSTATEKEVQQFWMKVLGLDDETLASRDDDFFLCGGSSLLASTFASELSKAFHMPLSGTALFKFRTIAQIAEAIDEHRRAANTKAALDPMGRGASNENITKNAEAVSIAVPHGKSCPVNATSIWPLLVQSLPLVIFHPVRRLVSWACFILLWIHFNHNYYFKSRFASMVFAIVIVRLALAILLPILGIFMKWLIVGRYKAGRHPLWGGRYLRWWFVNQLLRFCGRGVFDVSNEWRCRYYRALGAKIGRRVRISPRCRLTEADLVHIGDDSALDAQTTVSPFCVDGGEMMLSAIHVGSDCAVCTRTTIAPGATLPDGCCLPPLSSSHEIDDADPKYRDFCRAAFKPPPFALWLLIGMPLFLMVKVFAMMPQVILLVLMVQDRNSDPRTWYEAIEWFLSPKRFGYYAGIRLAMSLIAPFFEMAAVIVVKRLVIGRFVEGDNTSGWCRFQYWLMSALLPDGQLCGTAQLLGNHWGGVSCVLRCLGAKCGRRVFWPGSGLDVVEYDLLTIDDDVVFGSRSSFLCGDAKENVGIRLCAGSNVADRCVVLPGVTLGINGCLGTGSLAAKRCSYGEGCVTVGSTRGASVALTAGTQPPNRATHPKETLKGFGRVFYPSSAGGQSATWWVPPVWLFVLFVWFCHAFATIYHASYILLALWLADLPIRTHYMLSPYTSISSAPVQSRPMEWGMFFIFLARMLAIYIVVHLVMVLLIYAIDIACKWIIIGKRKPGRYAWDDNNYCMRWNLYLTTAVLRKHMLGYLQGSAYLVFYFRALGSRIGRNVCLYPTGSDPMMTEPDLVSIGDGACINFAFIICHTNSRGVFSLNRIIIEEGATMRSWSRIMAGAVLGKNAMLLEHTLALVGDQVDGCIIWQGWPTRDMITTDEYWRHRRHLIKLSRRQMKKYQKELKTAVVPAASTVQEERLERKMRAMQAQMAGLLEENAKLHAQLVKPTEHRVFLRQAPDAHGVRLPGSPQAQPDDAEQRANSGKDTTKAIPTSRYIEEIEHTREAISALPALPRQISRLLEPPSRAKSRCESHLGLTQSESLSLLTGSAETLSSAASTHAQAPCISSSWSMSRKPSNVREDHVAIAITHRLERPAGERSP